MKDPAQCVKDLLLLPTALGGFGAGAGWRIFIGVLPVEPDTIILVNQTGGRSPFPHLLYNEPSVQVLVRGAKNGYEAARIKMNDVVKRLLGMPSTVVQGDTYRGCNQIGDISWLGQDDNTRPIFSANFWFRVEPAAEAGDLRVPIT